MTLAFFSYAILTTITPGPNNIMSMSNASKYGFKRAVRFCLGVLIGFTGIIALCAVFCKLLAGFIPEIEPYMAVTGAGYILFLAWKVFRDKPHPEREPRLRTDSVLTGIILQFVNVKGILYAISVVSVYVLPIFTSAIEIALCIALLGMLAFASTICWALFGTVFERLFSKHKRLINILMALFLVYCAVMILFTTLK